MLSPALRTRWQQLTSPLLKPAITAGYVHTAHLRVDLSRRTYWSIVAAVFMLYLGAWVSHFGYIYGWLTDDYWFSFRKGIAVLHNARYAFGTVNGLTSDNILHAHLLTIPYLILKFKLSMPSYPIPLLGEATGNFRALLLYSIVLHAMILLCWAWFAEKIANLRLVAILSVVLFATSPTLLLWSASPASRLLGLPAALYAMWLITHRYEPDSWSFRQRFIILFLAGSMFWISQSLYWTTLYLLLPFAGIFWLVLLRRRWKMLSSWLDLAGFAFGLVWLQLVLELISFAIVGIPIEHGPSMTLLAIRQVHMSRWSMVGNLAMWGEWFTTLVGWPLLGMMALGWFLYFRQARPSTRRTAQLSLVTGLSVVLGLAYVMLSPTMPLFRHTAVFQPFLFLFASTAIVVVSSWIGRRSSPAVQLGIACMLLVATGTGQWLPAHRVFEAHQGLGRAIQWAHEHSHQRQLQWLPIAWYSESDGLRGLEELEWAAPGTWLLSYAPWDVLQRHPSLLAHLQRVEPLARWPTLWKTDVVHAEVAAFWTDTDWRYHPVLSEARVYDIDSLRQAMLGKPLRVRAVIAGSTATEWHEAVNVFDRDASPDGVTAWMSDAGPTPHSLIVQFTEAVSLSELDVVQPKAGSPPLESASRIAALEVQTRDERGQYRTIWSGDGLERYPVITAHWPTTSLTELRLLIRRQVLPWGDTSQASIEELVLPGYRVVAPAPQRSFPSLHLFDAYHTSEGLLLSGTNVTPHTVAVLNGMRLPTRALPETEQLLVTLPPALEGLAQEYSLHLTDGVRRSNSLDLPIDSLMTRQ